MVLRVREGVALTWDRSPFVFAAGMEHAIVSRGEALIWIEIGDTIRLIRALLTAVPDIPG